MTKSIQLKCRKALCMMMISLLLLYTQWATASVSDFQQAWSAYIRLRSSEEEIFVLKSQPITEENQTALRKAKAELTERKIDLHLLLSSENTKLDSWQKLAFQRKPHQLPKDLNAEILSKIFPEAKLFSPLEWKALKEITNQKLSKDFFLHTFSNETISESNSTPKKIKNVILVLDPYSKIFQSETPLEKLEAELKQENITLEIISISPFTKVEEQAEELFRLLENRDGEPAILLSAKEASAIVYRSLDLHPELKQKKEFLGWINIEGKLYGNDPEVSRDSRNLASIATHNNPVKNLESTAKQELFQLHKESIYRTIPLGKGFPILNYIPANSSLSAVSESHVLGGKIIFYSEKNNFSYIEGISTLEQITPTTKK